MAEAAFGVQLRRSRQAAALSLRQLATKVGYDHSYLSQVERGQRPGSAHLAQLCDRELRTGGTLTTAYEQARQPVGRAVPTVESSPGVPGGVDLLEAVRHGLATSLGRVQDADEWTSVTAGHARDIVTTPPAELLPELAADLELLRTTTAPTGSTALSVPAAELALLIALTLTALGRIRAAGRWWRTARATADSSADRWIGSRARGWEATSGLSEHRPSSELLELADDSLALAERPGCVARALAARAQILASLDRAEDARLVLDAFIAVVGDHLVEPSGDTSLYDWSAYKVHGVVSSVSTTLGDTATAYVAQERALALCPAGRLRERADIELQLARCLVLDGEVAAGLATAMRVLVELPDQWHTHFLYDAAGRVLSAVPGKDLGRAAVRDFRDLLVRRPYNRSVGSGSSSARSQG